MSFQPRLIEGDPEEVENPNAELQAADEGFTGPDIETLETEIAGTVYDRLRQRAPGWEPHPGNQEVWLTEAYAADSAELRTLLVEVPDEIFRTYGEEVLGLPARVPTPALGYATFTAKDDEGYQIRPGLEVILKRTGDELVVFQVVTGAQIETGETSVERVEISALDTGLQGNGLSGDAVPAEEVDWIESVRVPTQTYGGDDGQDATQYLAELSQLLRVVALRPVLPADYAILALRIMGWGGQRAVAMDGYKPDTKTWGHARCITLILAGADGNPVAPETKELVKTTLEALREVNVLIYVIDADYEDIDVSYEVTAFAEQNPDIVKEACDQALADYLSPARYRLGTTSPSITAGEVIPPPSSGHQPSGQTIRRHDLIGLLDRQRGVDWVVDVLIDDGDQADRELAGATVLPRPGTITGTVNEQ